MTAKEANYITTTTNVLDKCLTEVYIAIKASAEQGNYELLYSGIPVNLQFTEWDMLKENPNIRKDFIDELTANGYYVIDNSDERSTYKTITIRWKDIV